MKHDAKKDGRKIHRRYFKYDQWNADMMPRYAKRGKARQCASKARFRDIESAKRVRRRYPNQRIYHCRYCGGWHLTKRADALQFQEEALYVLDMDQEPQGTD